MYPEANSNGNRATELVIDDRKHVKTRENRLGSKDTEEQIGGCNIFAGEQAQKLHYALVTWFGLTVSCCAELKSTKIGACDGSDSTMLRLRMYVDAK